MLISKFASAACGPAEVQSDIAALYECTITHARSAPRRNNFSYGTYVWLVDVDRIPSLPLWMRPLASFVPADHFGDPRRSIRQNVDQLLRQNGIDLDYGRINMLCNARVFGYAVNPLSLYWCYDKTGSLNSVIAEVHNTHDQRHCYLLRTDDRGRVKIAKDFYVSPFLSADGHYNMTLPEPNERLAITIVLHTSPEASFVASLHGYRMPATMSNLLRATLRHPLPTLTVTARTYLQGLKLHCRRFPKFSRPIDHAPRGS